MKETLFTAIISEVDYVHPVFSIYPECREVLRNAFRNGRVEADCFYNQPNELTSNGEALVRNLIYGQLYHRDVLGRIVSVYSPEMFSDTRIRCPRFAARAAAIPPDGQADNRP